MQNASMEQISMPYILQKFPEERQVTHRDLTQNQDAMNAMIKIKEENFNSSNQTNDTSFRVENRRARPKIIKNVADRGNIFFSK